MAGTKKKGSKKAGCKETAQTEGVAQGRLNSCARQRHPKDVAHNRGDERGFGVSSWLLMLGLREAETSGEGSKA